MFQVRQGDVLVRAVKALPEKLQEVPRDAGRVVLAYGEVTGHAHAFHNSRVTMYREDGTGSGRTFLQVVGDEPAQLQHEEHSTIDVPPGNYEVVRQREYSPEAIRNVAD